MPLDLNLGISNQSADSIALFSITGAASSIWCAVNKPERTSDALRLGLFCEVLVMATVRRLAALPVSIECSVRRLAVEVPNVNHKHPAGYRTIVTVPRPERLNEYLILVPDFPNTHSLRRSAKAAHVGGAMPLIKDGRLPYFGVTLAKHVDTPAKNDSDADASQPKAEPDINGSVLVMKAQYESTIREFLAADAYTKAGVWDVKNARIIPFRAG